VSEFSWTDEGNHEKSSVEILNGDVSNTTRDIAEIIFSSSKCTHTHDLLGCNAVQFGRSTSVLRRNVSIPSSGPKSKPRKKPARSKRQLKMQARCSS
jgi:hypothetical protein